MRHSIAFVFCFKGYGIRDFNLRKNPIQIDSNTSTNRKFVTKIRADCSFRNNSSGENITNAVYRSLRASKASLRTLCFVVALLLRFSQSVSVCRQQNNLVHVCSIRICSTYMYTCTYATLSSFHRLQTRLEISVSVISVGGGKSQ